MLLLLMTATLFICTSAEILNVTIYYESLCTDSMRFITKQLHPVYLMMQEYISLNFIPYGHANMTRDDQNQWQFMCQHGEFECYGNKVQACALDINKEKSENFIYCAMLGVKGDAANDTILHLCAVASDLPWQNIKSCVDSDKGNALLSTLGNITDEAEVGYVPRIVFNSKYEEDLSKRAEFEFLSTVCKLLKNEPQYCLPVK